MLEFKSNTSKKTTFTAKTSSFDQAQPHASLDGAADSESLSPERAADNMPETGAGNESPSRTSSSTSNRSENADTSDDDVTIRGTSSNAADNTVTSSSFVTARESLSLQDGSSHLSPTHYSMPNPSAGTGETSSSLTATGSEDQRVSQLSTPAASALEAESTTSLLSHRDNKKAKSKVSAPVRLDPQPHDNQEEAAAVNSPDKSRSRLARFNLEDNVYDRQQRIRSRIERTQNKISAHRPRWSKESEGEMVRAQKMLVRVEHTSRELPPDYSEIESLRIDSREIAKWREYVVVCRKAADEHAPFTLKMYKSRVINDVEKSTSSAYYEIFLNSKTTRVNLYSTLDKTVVIWHAERRGTRIYIVKPRSSAHAVEWYTFIRQALGWHRPTSLLINVPDLGISLIFKDPFDQDHLGSRRSQNNEPVRISKEKIAAAAIICECMRMIKERNEWSQVLEGWSKTTKMGLAWKRFDRLEWIHGVNEGQMYGTIAMQTSHDLELRPKHHYPSTVEFDDETKEEPAPVEGFLIRLTSQRGAQQRLGKMFYKRQYFYTLDRFLCFCKQGKAMPPYASTGSDITPSRDSGPQISSPREIDPFPIQDNSLSWLDNGNDEFIRRQDENAFAHFMRTIHNLTNTDGLLDLCQVQSIQPINSGQISHSNRQINHEDNCIFEITLNNGLGVRFEAQNKETRDEWVKRLDALRQYWTARTKSDADELREIRHRNLKLLDIDERNESILGQFASKWEVKRAEASPHLYNMCHITGCRPIKVIRIAVPCFYNPG